MFVPNVQTAPSGGVPPFGEVQKQYGSRNPGVYYYSSLPWGRRRIVFMKFLLRGRGVRTAWSRGYERKKQDQ